MIGDIPSCQGLHRIHPSASRRGLSSSQFPAEKKCQRIRPIWDTSPHLPYVFFSYILVQKKWQLIQVVLENVQKHGDTEKFVGREDLIYQMNLFFLISRNGAKSACKPTKSTYVEYDFSSLRAGLENLIFHFGDSQIVIMIIWAFFT